MSSAIPILWDHEGHIVSKNKTYQVAIDMSHTIVGNDIESVKFPETQIQTSKVQAQEHTWGKLFTEPAIYTAWL